MNRICLMCPEPVLKKRADAVYCSDACRSAANRKRKREGAVLLPSPVESQLANALYIFDQEARQALAKLTDLSLAEAVALLQQVLTKRLGVANREPAASILARDAQQAEQDYEAYYKRTGIF